jgi:nucleoside-diphosphate-sugar epimerase
MGLDRRRRAALAERVGRIVHCAASVSFGLDLDTARAINVEGTRRLLDFASACELRGGFDCFTHVSTAYVAGTHSGSFGESDVDVGQGFRNTYERSKFEAELLVRRRGHSLPVQVMRPSIVVGDSRSGWTDSFNVLYLPLRAFSRGAYPAIPARRSAPVDVVPVDYVADAIVALAGRPGTTHNLVAGERASSVGELLELGSGYFGQRLPRLVPPWLYRRAVHPLLLRRGSEIRRLALRRSEQLFPYFAMRVRYDRRHTHAALEPLGIAPPPLPSYFGRLMDFAVEANWGRRAMPPRLRAQPLGHPGIAVAAVADPVV